ncbi:MAG: hypothetical protein H0T15_03600 [Thermoleophilaceae bacterium]|nr:hypothetical protein [Thermoleophilaceae bacterium]
MDLTRLARGEMLAAAAVPVLFVAMYLPWFSIAGSDISVDAWGSGGTLGLVLVVAMGATGILFLLRVTGTFFEFPFEWVVAGAGAAGFALVLYRILDPPLLGPELGGLEVTRRAGAYLGLVCAGAIAAGGFWSTREDARPVW